MNFKKLVNMLRLGAPFRRGQEPELPGHNKQHGAAGVIESGHRSYVGGLWEEVGRLQFEFLRSEGLSPEHVLLDVACGSLRAGVHLIPYLKPGHYLGIDKEHALIEAGLKRELGSRQARRSKPEFQVSADFDFSGFLKRPDYALAQSLFTHLPSALVDDCFRKLRAFIRPDGRFYATFFLCDEPGPAGNPAEAHDHRSFFFTRDEIESFGTRHGWEAHYIGEWGHPRGQVIARYRPC